MLSDGGYSKERILRMMDADISRRLSNISKEQLFANFSSQLNEMQARQDALQSEISARDAAIAQLRQQMSGLQQRSQMDKAMSDRLIQSAQHEAQGIINDANSKASSIIQQAQGTMEDANRQAQTVLQQAQARASEITDTQTRLLKSQIASLQTQKQQAAADAERCLQGIVDACDTFASNTNGYESDLQTLRDSAVSAIRAIQTERFVQSSIGNGSLHDSKQPIMQPAVPSGMQSGVPANQDDGAYHGADMLSQSPIDALFNAAASQQQDADDSSADVTAKMPPRQPQEQIIIPNDDSADDDFVFDPSDTISPEDAKSFTSEFNLGNLVLQDGSGDAASGHAGSSADDDDDQDDDFDMDVDGNDDGSSSVSKAQPRQRKQTYSKGQWF